MKLNSFMKKIIFLILFLVCNTTCSAANIHNLKGNFFNHLGHENCYNTTRWEALASDGFTTLLYDKYTIEEKNHYNPFGDKVIKLWVMYHLNKLHYTDKFLYEINLDDKTIKYLQVSNSKDKRLNKTLPIKPDSMEEMLYFEAVDIYNN